MLNPLIRFLPQPNNIVTSNIVHSHTHTVIVILNVFFIQVSEKQK